jgi:alpha-1,3-rhamnosyltransferase
MSAPLVTVIIPSYNHARYIESCVQSVLAQTWPHIELIVLDDGSTDDSPTILQHLAKQHRFYFESQANMGLARTLNKGIALSHGKYICTLGSDDIFMLDKTAKQVALLEARPDIAVCGGNQLVIDSDGILVNKRQKFPPYRELDFDDVFLDRKPGIAASSAMMRRDVLEREGAYDPEIRLEDMYLWFKLTARGHRIAGLNDVLIYYRKHATNSYKNLRYMRDNMLKTYAPYANHPAYARVVNTYLNSIFLGASKTDRALALETLRQIPLRHYSSKIPRGLLNMLKPRDNTPR